MKHPANIPLVTTIREKCRVCYTCVRECPAKAIRIAEGQAEVIAERCIACGNCVRVCSQQAKQVFSEIAAVDALLGSGSPVAAMLAPSFPAEFVDCDYQLVVGMLRVLGFRFVNEVGFGADLVAEGYRRLLQENKGKRYIASTCPAVIGYVERYHPELVDSLAPVVSPMVAMARALRQRHGAELKIVFIGPCIAKKGEAASQTLAGEVDAALTFAELREMLAGRGLVPEQVEPSDFDPPHASAGALFPVSRGLLQAAKISEDLVAGEVVVADGRTSFIDAIEEFETGSLDARLLEVLCCNGCIMGAGMTTVDPLFSRRRRISQYVRERLARISVRQHAAEIHALSGLDLSRTFQAMDQRIPVPFESEIGRIMAHMGKFKPEDELNCGACGYETCREHAMAIFKGLAETEMCLPNTIDQLRKAVQELAFSNQQLATTQEALMQSEKLASMGQLAAGIAHEVNNPLGVVLMYAHLLAEETPAGKLHDDLGMIVEQADRCKKIVAGLLNFARQNKVMFEATDLRELVARSLRAMTPPADVTVRTEDTLEDPMADLDGDQVAQVLTNLLSNAYAAMPEGGSVTVRTCGDEERVRFVVADTGIGIPPENLGRIFDPFFTTKQIGKGTGLGLAVAYGIVKMHRGDIQVETNADPRTGPTGTTFTVTLPRHGKSE